MGTPWCFFALCGALSAQSLVVDRAVDRSASLPFRVELDNRQFQGDSFRFGKKGEIWMMDAVRVWMDPGAGAACVSAKPAQAIARIALYGGPYNAPIPGVPECDCHALIPVVQSKVENGVMANRSVLLTDIKGLWQIDFKDVRWSVPGDLDILFTVRVENRGKACDAAGGWSLTAGPAPAGFKPFLFDKASVPAGFAPAQDPPRRPHIQVWAHKD